MNSVSWFIYIAQVSGSLGSLFVFLGVVIGGVLAGLFAIPRINNLVGDEKPGERGYWPPKALNTGYAALAVLFLIIGNLMPEKNTMYAIAASQVGEQIIKTEVATDATKALHQWIKRQIEPSAK